MGYSGVLEKAISKAIDRGWKQPWIYIHENVKDKKAEFMHRIFVDYDVVCYDEDQTISFEEIVFRHDFAKALWGNDPQRLMDQYEPLEESGQIMLDNWEYHLQQMVISEDPIMYLGENI